MHNDNQFPNKADSIDENALAESSLFEAAKVELDEVNQLTPPEDIWHELAKEISTNDAQIIPFLQKNNVKKGIWAMATAASLFMASFGWLMWSNYSLQQQLVEVLLINQTLESQLVQDATPTFYQAQLLSKVRIVELALMSATSSKEKLSLLKKRQNLITEMVKNSQGKDYEYSI